MSESRTWTAQSCRWEFLTRALDVNGRRSMQTIDASFSILADTKNIPDHPCRCICAGTVIRMCSCCRANCCLWTQNADDRRTCSICWHILYLQYHSCSVSYKLITGKSRPSTRATAWAEVAKVIYSWASDLVSISRLWSTNELWPQLRPFSIWGCSHAAVLRTTNKTAVITKVRHLQKIAWIKVHHGLRVKRRPVGSTRLHCIGGLVRSSAPQHPGKNEGHGKDRGKHWSSTVEEAFLAWFACLPACPLEPYEDTLSSLLRVLNSRSCLPHSIVHTFYSLSKQQRSEWGESRSPGFSPPICGEDTHQRCWIFFVVCVLTPLLTLVVFTASVGQSTLDICLRHSLSPSSGRYVDSRVSFLPIHLTWEDQSSPISFRLSWGRSCSDGMFRSAMYCIYII